jgi:hypothetical protein
MVERAEHQPVLALLDRLDATVLRDAACWLAGGTAVSLRCSEFRLSRDVDFLCASRAGYRELRERVYRAGARGLFSGEVSLRRDLRADRYGIRMVVDIDAQPIKLEIVSEGRIELDGAQDAELPVARLQDTDLVATKLLANEDRFLDDAALGRDIIDLVMLEHVIGGLPDAAWDKARGAYGPSVEDAYRRALARLNDEPALLARASEKLAITDEARRVIEERLLREKRQARSE